MLEHNVITRVRNEPTGSHFLGSRPEVTFPSITAITSIIKIRVSCFELRKARLRFIMINAEVIYPLRAIGKPAIHTLPSKFYSEKRFIGVEIRISWRRHSSGVARL